MRFAVLLLVLGSAVLVDAQRTPYLQRVTPSEATIVWRDGNASGRVCYGSAPTSIGTTVMATSSVIEGENQHEVRLTGLSTDTLYYYAAGASCPGVAPAGHRFRTAPMPGSRRPFRAWVVGDSGTGGSNQAAVRDAMLAATTDAPPDIFVHVGDMAYSDGTNDEFTDKFYAPYAEIMRNTVTWPAIGNHEAHTSVSGTESGPYYEGYVLPRGGEAGGMPSGTEAYYSFDWANVHFIVLDSADSGRDPGDPMLDWLEEDLSATDQEWLVAYWHHPPYTKGSHDSDREGTLIDMRENVLPILEAHGVHLVLAGHSHIYERSYLLHGAYDTPTTADGFIVDMGDGRLDGDGAYDMNGTGTLYIVAGHGGTGVSRDEPTHPVFFFDEVENGSVLLDVDGGTLTFRNIRYDGVETDYGTLVQGEGLYLLSPMGGETYLAGSTVPIRWGAAGVTPTAIDIHFSIDGGSVWYPLVVGTEDDGVYEWTTPGVVTDQAMVRIRDSLDATLMDVSREFSLTNVRDDVLIPFGGTWEYSDGPTPPAADWRTTTGGWSSGDAQLGYGEGDETTTLMDADPNIPTVYFRTSIDIDGTLENADLDVLFDDGFAVWINDELVFQRNMDDGTDHDVFASSSSSDNERASTTVDPSVFVEGANIVAAIVKQSSGGSSDLSFDLRLTGRVAVTLPDDAGLPVLDGGSADGGVGDESDGGVGLTDDGAVAGDASAADAGEDGGGGGCGCGVASPAHSFAWLLLLVWVRRRR